jgi:hypothetical protein
LNIEGSTLNIECGEAGRTGGSGAEKGGER